MGALFLLVYLMAMMGIGYPLVCFIVGLVLKAKGKIRSVREFMRRI